VQRDISAGLCEELSVASSPILNGLVGDEGLSPESAQLTQHS
jgi:hypothetical protein